MRNLIPTDQLIISFDRVSPTEIYRTLVIQRHFGWFVADIQIKFETLTNSSKNVIGYGLVILEKYI